MDISTIVTRIVCLSVGILLLVYNKQIGEFADKHFRNPYNIPKKIANSIPWNPRVSVLIIAFFLIIASLEGLIL